MFEFVKHGAMPSGPLLFIRKNGASSTSAPRVEIPVEEPAAAVVKPENTLDFSADFQVVDPTASEAPHHPQPEPEPEPTPEPSSPLPSTGETSTVSQNISPELQSSASPQLIITLFSSYIISFILLY